MKKLLKPLLTLVVAVGVIALAVWGFMGGRKEFAMERERERPVKPPLRVAFIEGEPVVIFDQTARQKAGLAVAPLKPATHREELEAYATVVPVQELVELRNNYVAAKAPIAKSRVNIELARQEYERMKALHDADRNVSDKVFLAAQAALRAEETNATAGKDALTALEGTARQHWGPVLGKAMIDSAALYTNLAELKEVLIQVTLPVGVELAEPPATIRIKPQGSLMKEATFVSPAPRTDPRVQGMSLYYRAPAAGLFPGMNLPALLPTANEARGFIVPRSAFVSWQGKSWVYVQKAADRFARRELLPDMPSEDGWFATQVFKPDEQVVVKGAQLLLSEELRAQIQVGEEGEKEKKN